MITLVDLQEESLEITDEWKKIKAVDAKQIPLTKLSKLERWERTVLANVTFRYSHKYSKTSVGEKIEKTIFRIFDLPNYTKVNLLIRRLSEGTRELNRYINVVEPLLDPKSRFKASRFLWFGILLDSNKSQPPGQALLSYYLLYPLVDDFVDDPKTSLQQRKHLMMLLDQTLTDFQSKENQPEQSSLKLFSSRISRCVKDLFDSTKDFEQREELLKALDLVRFAEDFELLGNSADFISAEQRAAIKGTAAMIPMAVLQGKEITYTYLKELLTIGFACQMVDDLQDCAQDLQAGIQTVFSERASKGLNLDDLACKLLLYLVQLREKIRKEHPDQFMETLPNALLYLTLEAITQQPKHFSFEFAHQIHKFLPVISSWTKRHPLEWQLYNFLLKLKLD